MKITILVETRLPRRSLTVVAQKRFQSRARQQAVSENGTVVSDTVIARTEVQIQKLAGHYSKTRDASRILQGKDLTESTAILTLSGGNPL